MDVACLGLCLGMGWAAAAWLGGHSGLDMIRGWAAAAGSMGVVACFCNMTFFIGAIGLPVNLAAASHHLQHGLFR